MKVKLEELEQFNQEVSKEVVNRRRQYNQLNSLINSIVSVEFLKWEESLDGLHDEILTHFIGKEASKNE
jgi:hypothetical protein